MKKTTFKINKLLFIIFFLFFFIYSKFIIKTTNNLLSSFTIFQNISEITKKGIYINFYNFTLNTSIMNKFF
jgi:ABC-type spermidine/putrescine transport system permease subunit I